MTGSTELVDVYRIGFLYDLHRLRMDLRHPLPDRSPWQIIRARFGWFLRFAPTRSYWKGYAAEPTWPSDGSEGGPPWRRCGTGWTRKRAMRDLARHLEEVAG